MAIDRLVWQMVFKNGALKQVYNISSVFAAADKLAAIVLKRTWIRVGCGSILRARKWAWRPPVFIMRMSALVLSSEFPWGCNHLQEWDYSQTLIPYLRRTSERTTSRLRTMSEGPFRTSRRLIADGLKYRAILVLPLLTADWNILGRFVLVNCGAVAVYDVVLTPGFPGSNGAEMALAV
jgi:hypothetical protein